MNKREQKELVALRAVELFSFMNMVQYDESERLPPHILKDLRDAVDSWNPSVAECQQIKERLKVQ